MSLRWISTLPSSVFTSTAASASYRLSTRTSSITTALIFSFLELIIPVFKSSRFQET